MTAATIGFLNGYMYKQAATKPKQEPASKKPKTKPAIEGGMNLDDVLDLEEPTTVPGGEAVASQAPIKPPDTSEMTPIEETLQLPEEKPAEGELYTFSEEELAEDNPVLANLRKENRKAALLETLRKISPYAVGGVGGAALGGGGSVAYDKLRGQDVNYRRALILAALGGGAGVGAAGLGKTLADRAAMNKRVKDRVAAISPM